jgi:HEAT repeat protein
MSAAMRSMTLSMLFLALAAAPAFLSAAEPDRLAKLEADLKAAAGYEFGKDAGPLERIEREANELSRDPDQGRAVEKLLLQALASASTRDAKDFLCRELRTIATVRTSPAVLPLAEMLADPQLSHLARYVLEPLEDPAADAALRAALGKTSGKIQAGILGTLGRRQSVESVLDVAKLLGSEDIAVAEAAAAALGMIGGEAAAKALEDARPRAKDAVKPWIDDALLACAGSFLKKGEKAPAARIYESFLAPGTVRDLRVGALRGLAAAQGDEAIPRVVAAIRDPDARLAACAIDVARTMKSPAAGKEFSKTFDSLTPDMQELLVSALPVASVLQAAKSEHRGVRAAAFEALGRIGDAAYVLPLLLQTAAEARDRVQAAARASLLGLPGSEIDGALERNLGQGRPQVRIEAIRALAGRQAKPSYGRIRELAHDGDGSVRAEAIGALGRIAEVKEIETLAKLALDPRDPADRPAIEGALETAFRRNPDREKQAGPVLAAFAGAPAEAKPALVRLLGKAATAKALEAVRASLAEAGPVREAALKALAEWPNASPADDLLRLARDLPDLPGKELAMGGYLRMAGGSKDADAMYKRALESADKPEGRAMVLRGLGASGTAAALELVEKSLVESSEPVRAAAVLASVRIAERIRQQDPSAARAALQKALEANPDADTRKKAQDLLATLEKLEKNEGFILRWMVSGPIQADGKDGKAIFDAAFPPEDLQAKDVAWKRLRRGAGAWDIDLAAALGSLSQCGAYVRTAVWSDDAAEARLEIGSDDAVKAWINGQLVHSNWLSRAREPGQDKVDVKLQKGWNTLLLKVVNIEGPWGFGCRVTRRDGGAIAGLKVEPR